MEIISYVGAASSSRSRRRQKVSPFSISIPRSLRDSQKSFSFGKSQRTFKMPAESSAPGFLVRTISTIRFAKVSDLKWFFVTVAMMILVPMTVSKIVHLVEDYAAPVHFQTNSETEVDFLNNAMAKFAMEDSEDSFDENGNVLAEDGTILTAASVGIGQTVTYQKYTVRSGDTISGIARRFGLTNISTLIAINHIENVRTLRSGQKLKIPSQDGLIHVVKAGESLNALSVKYHVSLEEICDANDISDVNLYKGQEIFIPGAKMDSSSLRKAMGELFIYPIKASWRLTSRFGPRADPFTGVKSSHTGIDMACPTGTPVYAAMSGKVVYAGWSNIFGNYVIINHENGYQTLYGHLSKMCVKNGARVTHSTKIGLVGSTGYSTGPHLHLTVYKNGKLVDPQTVLK